MGSKLNLGNGSSVIAFLKGQHQEIKELFAKVFDAEGEARAESFYELRRLMSRHEAAEEQIVHPTARSVLPNGVEMIAKRLDEEEEAKRSLVELESLDVSSPDFEAKLRELQGAVLAHAKSEEIEEFDRLAAALDEKQLYRMRTEVETAEAEAPTRPHPGAKQSKPARAVTAMADRARDVLSGKS